MEKALFIAKLLAQLATEYSAEVARSAQTRGFTDKQVHDEIQRKLDANERQALANNEYFKKLAK